MSNWVIEALRPEHTREAFSCGKLALDTFLHSLAGQYEKRRLGRTVVATEPGNMRVAGYYTIAAGALDATVLPEKERKKLPRHPIPTIHLGRLAVDQGWRGHGLGETLLIHALRTAIQLGEKIGAFAVEVRALDDEARAFYARYGFLELEGDPLHLYLPLKTVEGMFDS
jgi:GNAT superfamily N-acetyltransferase